MAPSVLLFRKGKNSIRRRLNTPIKIELPIRFWIADIPQEVCTSTTLPKPSSKGQTQRTFLLQEFKSLFYLGTDWQSDFQFFHEYFIDIFKSILFLTMFKMCIFLKLLTFLLPRIPPPQLNNLEELFIYICYNLFLVIENLHF